MFALIFLQHPIVLRQENRSSENEEQSSDLLPIAFK